MREATRIMEGEWVIRITAVPGVGAASVIAEWLIPESGSRESFLVNRAIVSLITPALSPSKALVGSSSTSTLGLLTKALAIHSRCACPPLKPLPPSPIRVWYPSGKPAMKSWIPAALAAPWMECGVERGEWAGKP